MLFLVPVLLGPAVMASGPSPVAAPGGLLGDVVTSKAATASEPGELVLETEAGQEALRSASGTKKKAYALEGEEREAVLLEAAAAFGAVADAEEFGVLDRVEGAFRAGEILRARGKAGEAAARFALTVELGEPVVEPAVREFAARALLEEGHQLRREGEADRALGVYEAVRGRFSECARPCTHAITWSGKILLKEGRIEEARSTLLIFEPFIPEYPLGAVRNVDALVDALVAQGQAERAYEAVASLEDSISKKGVTMTETTTRALEALRDKVSQSGY